MAEGKGPDEIYCRSCGAVIKRAAEICPECGVRNDVGADRSSPIAGGGSSETIFCRSCGEEIKRQAEICPHCGVGNPLVDGSQSTDGTTSSSGAGGSAPASTGAHDPSEYPTTVSENWHWGVAASVGLWLLGLAIPVESLAGMFMLVAWVLMPVSIYYDKRWLRANTSWNPNAVLWIVGSLVLLANIVVGAVYLVRRHGVTRDATPVRADDEPEDDALALLRRRYSRGELTDEEFEVRVEKILETEDRETARHVLEGNEPDAGTQSRSMEQ